jgi:hypothetical protein
MTPVQFAKEQCSNYQGDCSCLGMGINDDGTPRSFGAKPKCVLHDKGRCQFFEDCVLPMGIDPVNKTNEVRREEQQEAIKIYGRWHGTLNRITAKSGRVCPRCRKRELDSGKQLCYVCRDERRQERGER